MNYLTESEILRLEQIARQLRIDSVKMITSGNPATRRALSGGHRRAFSTNCSWIRSIPAGRSATASS